MLDLTTIAKEYAECGLSSLPTYAVEKRPYGSLLARCDSLKDDKGKVHWEGLQKNIPNDILISKLFSSMPDNAGIGLICGAVSANLECLDIDNHIGTASANFQKFGKNPFVLEIFSKKVPVVLKTQGGGFHVWYRCVDAVGGNKKLAMAKVLKDGVEKKETIFETRGEGGYALIPPTAKYTLARGSFKDLPILTVDERDLVLCVARSFEQDLDLFNLPISEDMKRNWEQTAWDAFNHAKSCDYIVNLLVDAGWTYRESAGLDEHFLTRPGKDVKLGQSGVVKMCPTGVFFSCFSSNALPFTMKSYSAFQVYCLLKHGGNFSAAAQAIFNEGFGKIKKEIAATVAATVPVPPVVKKESKNRQMIISKKDQQAVITASPFFHNISMLTDVEEADDIDIMFYDNSTKTKNLHCTAQIIYKEVKVACELTPMYYVSTFGKPLDASKATLEAMMTSNKMNFKSDKVGYYILQKKR